MRIYISTSVACPIEKVWQGFDENLFKALSPPFPRVLVERFDGCITGHEVHLKLLFPFFPQQWNALIVQHQVSDKEIFFVDTGTKLPFFLKNWHHKHSIVKIDNANSAIVDDIDFSSGRWITDVVLFPFLWVQFVFRKPIYQKYFKKIGAA